ncbi:MAG: 50S ribosomal protein L7/L12 [Bifidobacteriaceae bacterium]|jgi:large subunit ribosomal protein L7/L12|nr:50S ribosomal protein L7/L12 [Bifidobacteriaceae bacterium]
MAKLTIDELIEQFKGLTLIELTEFVKKFEEVFDVTAAAPAAVAVAAAPGAATAETEPEEEQSEFDVILDSFGEKKIQVIKVVRQLTTPALGLGEAKALVEAAPKPILEKVNKETAEKAKAALEEVGATVTLK